MVTATVVATGVLLVGPALTTVSSFPPWWMVALTLGLCAATSSSLPPDPTRSSHDVAARLDVQDYLLHRLRGVLLAFCANHACRSLLVAAMQRYRCCHRIAACCSCTGLHPERVVYLCESPLLAAPRLPPIRPRAAPGAARAGGAAARPLTSV